VSLLQVISDGSSQSAKRLLKPQVAHGLCHFHYLREADMLIYEADRHAEEEKSARRWLLNVPLTTQMSQSQKLCRAIVKRCAIALTDDGRPPLDASGLRLQQRLNAIEQSLERVAQKGLPCSQPNSNS